MWGAGCRVWNWVQLPSSASILLYNFAMLPLMYSPSALPNVAWGWNNTINKFYVHYKVTAAIYLENCHRHSSHETFCVEKDSLEVVPVQCSFHFLTRDIYIIKYSHSWSQSSSIVYMYIVYSYDCLPLYKSLSSCMSLSEGLSARLFRACIPRRACATSDFKTPLSRSCSTLLLSE